MCDGLGGLPGNYDAKQRLINLNTTLEEDPQLAVATLIHGVVNDMLYQSTFSQPHFPELVELAVIGTGLGVLRSNLMFVKKVASILGLYALADRSTPLSEHSITGICERTCSMVPR